jgi:anti-anti-sigma factor
VLKRHRVPTNSIIRPGAQASLSAKDGYLVGPQPRSIRDQAPWLEVREVGGWTIIEIRNAEFLIEHDAICELSAELHRVAKEGQSRLLLNLGGIRAISGEMLAVLAGLYRTVKSQSGRLGIFGLQPLFRDMLRICHLDQVIEIYADEPEALRNSGQAS